MRWRLRTGFMLAGGLLAFTLAGCDVDRTQPGQAPAVDVDVDPGRWPEYDVDWADVNVGTQERMVEVPVVRVETERRQVSVPYIDIKPAGASDFEERTITMELDVPHAGYNLSIAEIRAAGDDLWVVGVLQETGGVAAQMMTRVADHVVVNVPEELDVRKIVVGQRPPGVFNQQYRFVDSMETLERLAPDRARVIYKRGA